MLYNPEYVAFRPILSQEEQNHLNKCSLRYTLDELKADTRNYEEMTTDFVHTSAQIEGNTYERIETDNLLRLGITAGGKRYTDAVMLLNLRNGFEQVMLIGEQSDIDVDYICNLHKVVMKDLLPIREQGIVSDSGVQIGASQYRPIVGASRLKTKRKWHSLFQNQKNTQIRLKNLFIYTAI